MRWKQSFFAILAVALVSSLARAGDLRITLPKRSRATPVQALNRDGVEAIRKNNLEKAKQLFYKAYLFDPDDPFTLNNLGYVSELEGQVDRAQRFYSLAKQNATEAVIDRASARDFEGKTVADVEINVQDKTMRVNRDNVEAVRLLSQGRAPEADLLLRKTLELDPNSPFTLNNYAVAREMEGDYEQALKYYQAAAKSGCSDPVIVTLDRSWRGKPVCEMAATTASKLWERMQSEQSLEVQVGRLNLQGVSALNRNAVNDARKYFEQAFQLAPENAFTLNNRGYVSELDGDPESAKVYYEKAQQSPQAGTRVGYATRQVAEGKALLEVAGENDQKMDTRMAQVRESRRPKQSGRPALRRRDNSTVVEPDQPLSPPDDETRPSLGPPQPPVPQLDPNRQR